MGSGCSSQSSATASQPGSGAGQQHHNENDRNRLNPTEKVANWREKMLLDIGSDPMSVVRDFPRMNVFPIFDKEEQAVLMDEGNYAHYNNDSDSGGGGGPTPVSVNATATAASGKYRAMERDRNNHSRSGGGRRRSLPTPLGSGGCATAPNPLTPHRRGSTNADRGGNNDDDDDDEEEGRIGNNNNNNSSSSCDMSELDATNCHSNEHDGVPTDPFAARRRRLRQNVLAIAEMVGEGPTFGRWFQQSWDAKERETFFSCDDAAATAAAASTHLHTTNSDTFANHNNNNNSNIHQSGGGFRRKSGSGIAGSRRNGHGSGAVDIHQFFHSVCIDCGMIVAAPPAGGAAGSSSDNVVNNNNNNIAAMGSSSHYNSISRDAAGGMGASTTNRARTTTTAAGPGASTPAMTTAKSAYLVASATFHVLQFLVQGVMFFPFQRLKHIFWYPWAPSSLFSDVDWKIFLYVEENVSSVSKFVFAKKLKHAAHGRSGKRPLHARQQSHMPPPPPVGAPLREASDCVTESTPLLPQQQQPLHSRTHSAFAADAQASTTTSRGGGGGGAGTGGGLRRLLVIKHLQVVRHFVEEAERKKVPRYELDWLCSIYLDLEQLSRTYAPFADVQRRRRFLRLPPCQPGASMHSTFNADEENNNHNEEEDHAPFGGTATPTTILNGTAAAAQPNNGSGSNNNAKFTSSRASSNVGTPAAAPSTTLPTFLSSVGGHGRSPYQLPHLQQQQHAGANSGASSIAAAAVPPAAATAPLASPAVGGVPAAEQAALVAREAVYANIDVAAARVERVKKGLCGVPAVWAQNVNELRFALEEQYDVELEEVAEMKNSRY